MSTVYSRRSRGEGSRTAAVPPPAASRQPQIKRARAGWRGPMERGLGALYLRTPGLSSPGPGVHQRAFPALGVSSSLLLLQAVRGARPSLLPTDPPADPENSGRPAFP